MVCCVALLTTPLNVYSYVWPLGYTPRGSVFCAPCIWTFLNNSAVSSFLSIARWVSINFFIRRFPNRQNGCFHLLTNGTKKVKVYWLPKETSNWYSRATLLASDYRKSETIEHCVSKVILALNFRCVVVYIAGLALCLLQKHLLAFDNKKRLKKTSTAEIPWVMWKAWNQCVFYFWLIFMVPCKKSLTNLHVNTLS